MEEEKKTYDTIEDVEISKEMREAFWIIRCRTSYKELCRMSVMEGNLSIEESCMR